MRKAKLLMGFSILLFGCSKQDKLVNEDFFYLQNNGSIMPVWVKGNPDSDKMIVMLHGGPDGGSSQYYTIFPSHERIEKEARIVYWDQRMCGMSQGNPSMKDATMEQFSEDLDKLISILNSKYDEPQIYLMGHSWGGALGTYYLIRHQSKINGWIEIDGGHAWTRANLLSREIMMDHAQKKINEQDNTNFWNFALDWYNKHPTVGINEDAHYTFVAHANGYDYNFESDSLPIPFTELLFRSPISTAYFFAPYNFNFLDQGLDLQDGLSNITIPTLICWGEHDKVFPVQMAYDTYADLGTPDADKHLKIFGISAHSPNYEQPMEFANTVLTFINAY